MEQTSELDAQHTRDLVVIGASAGGVETLKQVVGRLPGDLRATVCVVLHIAPDSPSALASILGRAGPLPCHAAVDGEPLVAGRILVAPPDRHLVIEDGRARLTVGPRENNHRPAVDALFRTAAAARGDHVIGVVLSGMRDDGTAGLAVIKAHGGLAIVQDPDEALYPGMPASAIANVTVDAVVPAAQIADTIALMVRGITSPEDPRPDPPPDSAREAEAETTICPECGGVLSEHVEAGTVQWRCRVGHRYSPETLIELQANDVEAALWSAVRALEDRARLLGRMADQLEIRDQPRSARRFRRHAHEAEDQAQVVRTALAQAARTTLSPVGEADGDTPAEESIA